VGFEPGIIGSGGRRDDHNATPPGHSNPFLTQKASFDLIKTDYKKSFVYSVYIIGRTNMIVQCTALGSTYG
jgi:hypothetical protein